jgi:hypothetical protein
MASGPNELQRIALELPCLTLDDIADAIGESPDSLKGYREGSLELSPMLKHRLAEFLREHASTILRLAGELDRTG